MQTPAVDENRAIVAYLTVSPTTRDRARLVVRERGFKNYDALIRHFLDEANA